MLKLVQYIKDFLKPSYKTPDSVNADMESVRKLCRTMFNIRASDGRKYVYFILKEGYDIHNVQQILLRNNVRAKPHKSKCYYGIPILRVRKTQIQNNIFVKQLLEQKNVK